MATGILNGLPTNSTCKKKYHHASNKTAQQSLIYTWNTQVREKIIKIMTKIKKTVDHILQSFVLLPIS